MSEHGGAEIAKRLPGTPAPGAWSDDLILALVDRLTAVTGKQARAQKRLEDYDSERDALVRGLREDLAVSQANAEAWHGNFQQAKEEVETLTRLNSEQAEELAKAREENKSLWDQVHRDQHDAMDQGGRADKLQEELDELRKDFDCLRELRMAALKGLSEAESKHKAALEVLAEVREDRNSLREERNALAGLVYDQTTGQSWKDLHSSARSDLDTAQALLKSLAERLEQKEQEIYQQPPAEAKRTLRDLAHFLGELYREIDRHLPENPNDITPDLLEEK